MISCIDLGVLLGRDQLRSLCQERLQRMVRLRCRRCRRVLQMDHRWFRFQGIDRAWRLERDMVYYGGDVYYCWGWSAGWRCRKDVCGDLAWLGPYMGGFVDWRCGVVCWDQIGWGDPGGARVYGMSPRARGCCCTLCTIATLYFRIGGLHRGCLVRLFSKMNYWYVWVAFGCVDVYCRFGSARYCMSSWELYVGRYLQRAD